MRGERNMNKVKRRKNKIETAVNLPDITPHDDDDDCVGVK